MTSFRPLPLSVYAAAPAAMVCFMPALTTEARADSFTDTVNNYYAQIRPEHRSDTILLPVVAKMQPAPAVVSDFPKAMLLPHGSANWSAAQEWAMAEPQRAVLAALGKAVANTQMAFGQPYGADAVAAQDGGIELIEAGLYTELGDPPLLSAANFLYLPKVEQIGYLVNVEATRLAGEGQIDQAIKVLGDWLFFSRQMADREFFKESRFGLRSMIATLDRIRDVAYQDFRSGSPKLTIDHIMAILDRIRTEDGYLMGDRLTFPMGNRIAADQVVARAFVNRGGVNEATFGQTMARLASTERPLRLFSEAARWGEVGRAHANWFDTTEQLNRVYADWTARWPLDPFDRRQSLVPDYQRTSDSQYAVIKTLIPDMSVLFNDRQILRAQLVGTRNALGVLAFYTRNRNFPPSLASIRPIFVKVIEADPFNPDPERARGKQPPLEYFVPIRDQRFGEREDPRPHEINVVTGSGMDNFRVSVGQDQFVLYSVGPDGRKDWARDVSGEPAKDMVGDLLLWPPVTSLVRQRLLETGKLK
jgi:hypothetical protein